jgi:5-methylcytosine-specific restriction endonuclease McrA
MKGKIMSINKTANELLIVMVWNKAQPIPGKNPSQYRKDRCGATIERNAHGDVNHPYGWEIDHINPVSNGGGDSLSNLQPLHWRNNRAKGDSLSGDYCVVRI